MVSNIQMKNSEDQVTPNIIVTESITWKGLAVLAGMCLTHHELAQKLPGEDSRLLAEEIASQVAFQAMKAGIDPKTKASENVSMVFTVPLWATVFMADIMQALREEGNLDLSTLAVFKEFAPFARAAVAALDASETHSIGDGPYPMPSDDEKYPGDLPAHRLN
jgi:hypothetical protein